MIGGKLTAPIEFRAKYGAWLEAHRDACGLSRAVFGGLIGVSRNTVLRWENGLALPDFYYAVQINAFFAWHLGWRFKHFEPKSVVSLERAA